MCKDSNAVAKGEIKELTALRKTVNLEREAIGNLRGRVERMSKDYQRERSKQKRIIDGLQTQLRHTQIYHQKEKRENKRVRAILSIATVSFCNTCSWILNINLYIGCMQLHIRVAHSQLL